MLLSPDGYRYRLKTLAARAISDLQELIDYRRWPGRLRECMLSAIMDLQSNLPYATDPTRDYTLVYQHGRFVGATFEADELGLHLVRQQEDYWFVEVGLFPMSPNRYT